MVRYFLLFLAVLVAVLAYLFDRPWLWVGVGVVFVGGLAYVGWQTWESFTEDGEKPPRPDLDPASEDESLEELGIMEIRPQGEEPDEESASTSPAPDAGEDDVDDASSTVASSHSTESSKNENARTGGSAPAVSESRDTVGDRTVVTGDAPVLGPLMQSLRAALEAKTVCLLVQEEVALSYRIEAVASTQPRVRLSGSFSTQTPLMTASMAEKRSVTIRRLPEDGLAVEDLGYYQRPPSIEEVAVVPIPRPDDPTSTFLLADGTAETDLGSSRSRTILEEYVELVDLVLAKDRAVASEEGGAQRTRQDSTPVPGSGSENASELETGGPRPRRELIAEEMEAAEAASEGLALVLVHLNRAESIARRGKDAVASAERLFRARLEQAVPNQRVERFGELTYGIFYRGDLDQVESWVADLDTTMDAEKGELEGGVSVGVALWRERDEDPEGLRGAATDALREAYETGTSTIVT